MAFGKEQALQNRQIMCFRGVLPLHVNGSQWPEAAPRSKFNPEPFATQKPKSKTQKPKSKTQNPKSKTQNPKSKAQHPKSKNQKVLNVKWPPRAGNPKTFKASRTLPAAGGSGRQLATSTLNYSEPQKVGTLIYDDSCWDSRPYTLL